MQTLREQLSCAYRICAMLGLDDHTYTHLSACVPGHDHYYLQPFGYKFAEITAEKLLTLSYGGEVLAGEERFFNPTAYYQHGPIYAARPDVGAVFHLHTPAIVAVSCLQEGLLPLSQWALQFYGRTAYHHYDSLLLHEHQSHHLVEDLASNSLLLMRNHGCLIAASTVQEAMYYAYHLEQACKTQCLALSMSKPLVMPEQGTACLL